MSNPINPLSASPYREREALMNGYETYKKAIHELLKKPNSKFNIGICGEWGLGKTTFMNSIYEDLKNSEDNVDVVPIWFNAWQYEREENFALIPLLSSMASALKVSEKETSRKQLRMTILAVCKGLLKSAPDILSLFLPGYLGENVKKAINTTVGNVGEGISSTEFPEKIVESLFYTEGLKKIEEEIIKIRSEGSNFKIVVFVDDLDRCSPKKVIEVFESVKVLRDIEGFVFVLGIDSDRLLQIFEKEYGEEGEDYLDRIVQLPIYLPPMDQ